MSDKKVIGIAQILAYLKDGKTRKEIAEIYGINMAEMKQIFMHEQLKGKKTFKKKAQSYLLVEDESNAVTDVEIVDEEVVGDEFVAEEPALMPEDTEEAVGETAEGPTEPVATTEEVPKSTWED